MSSCNVDGRCWIPVLAVLHLMAAPASRRCEAQVAAGAPSGVDAISLSWRRLAALPDPLGFAGSFAGVSNGALLAAGGANFPRAAPWQGGEKVWYDSIFVLESSAGAWRRAGRLPRASGYGVSIDTERGVACLGGGDAIECRRECFLLRWESGKVVESPLPMLPAPRANACGVKSGTILYLIGGIERPDDAKAQRSFWALDLCKLDAGWQTLKSWPGPERMLATAASLDGSVYLFSGASLHAGSAGKPVRRWLKDAYRYRPQEGWKRIADLPRPAVAAPSPAPSWGRAHILILGGDDGVQANSPPTAHRGFPRDALEYDSLRDAWSIGAAVPFSLVATPCCRWEDCVVVPGGEIKPGVRSTEVWAGRIPETK